MTLTRRVVACLDVKRGRVVKGVGFVDLRDVGDPVELAQRYERDGADEIVFLDISATSEERKTLLDLATRTAECLFIPLTIGGGVRSADDVGRALRAGADKVSLNSAAVERPAVITDTAERFGSQCVVVSIDAKSNARGGWEVYVRGGSQPTGREAVEWAAECVALGAGEILLTSIDRDGSRRGYELELTRTIAAHVNVPVVASGGAGTVDDVVDVFTHSRADAALVAGILHEGATSVGAIKRQLAIAGIPVRQSRS